MKNKPTETERRIEIAPLTFRAEIRPASIDAEARTVELVFSTGAAVQRMEFWSGQKWIETLSLNPKHVRLGRLNSGAPFLDSHSAWGVSSVLGVVEPETARIEDDKGIATVRFSKREDVEPIWQDVRDGIIRNVSVGYRVHKFEETNTDGKIPVRHAVDWEPYEISAVPMGADDGAKMRAADQAVSTNTCVIVTREAQEELPMDPKLAAAPQPPAPSTPAPVTATAIDEARASATQAERDRIAGIEKIVRSAGLDPSFGKKYVDEGSQLDVVRTAVLEELATKSEAGASNGHQRVAVIGDEADKFARGAAAWIFTKAAVTPLIARAIKESPALLGGEVSLDPGEFRGFTMLDLARESLERSGVKTRGMDKMHLVARALTFRAPGGMASTSDFPVLLENVMHKILLAAYGTTPDTWRRFCAVGSVSDFRAHNRYRMGTFGSLDTVKEHGEFTNKSIPDGEKQSITAATKGNIIGISRQSIVNDDMDAFSRLATMFGRAARLSIEVDVYALLKLNAGLGPTLSDGKTLFHADHSNVGVAAGLGVEGIEGDRVKLASQTDVSGNEILDLRPAVLVVPIGIGGDARVVNDSQYDPGVEGEQNRFMVPNKVRGLYRDIVDTPRLTGTRRYSFADPSVAAVLEVAFLDGQQEPFLESQDGWRIDGTEWKVRLDYATGAIDFRGAVTNAGA